MRVKDHKIEAFAGLLLSLLTAVSGFGQMAQPLAGSVAPVAAYSGEGRSSSVSGASGERRFESGKVADVTEIAGEEERAIIGLYTSYLAEYRLGPSDVISVEIFGQCPDYCKNGITVPPTAKISYPLIRGGVFVGGKTVDEVADEVAEKLKDYITDPKVTVTLEKPMSNRYSVTGKVASPGIKIMDRKLTVIDAILEAGGFTRDSDKGEALLIRFNTSGEMMKYKVDLGKIAKGKAEMVYVAPGDQVYVPSRKIRINANTVFDTLSKVAFIRYFFGIPF